MNAKTTFNTRTFSLIAVFIALIAALLPAAHPAFASSGDVNACYIYQNGEYTRPTTIALEPCARLILAGGDLISGWKYGYWGEAMLAVDQNGVVMAIPAGEKSWVNLGTLNLSSGSANQNTGSGSGSSASSSQVVVNGKMVYRGTLTIKVQTFDVYGRANGVQTYSSQAEIVLDRARSGENNPFFMIISTATQCASIISTLSTNGMGVYQYWTYSADSRGNISGELTSAHNSEALSWNAYAASQDLGHGLVMPNYAPMGVGSRMQGKFDQKTFQMTVTGAGINQMNPFEITIQADRAQ